MPEGTVPMPQTGEGSRTPSPLPSLHTPVGEGEKATGVNNVGKGKGMPGAPLGGGLDLGGGGLGGASGDTAQPMQPLTPEQMLFDRSEKRLTKDLEDIILKYENSQKYNLEKVASVKKSFKIPKFDDDFLDYALTELVGTKGWNLERLKELIPSRDEKEIKEYLENLVRSKDTQKEVDVNQQENNPINNIIQGGLMSGKTDIIVKDGALESVVTDRTVLFDRLATSITQLRKARKEAKSAFLKKAGYVQLKRLADFPMSDLEEEPIEGGDANSPVPGMDMGGDSDPFGPKEFDDFTGDMESGLSSDLDSKINDVKSLLEDIQKQVKEIGATSDNSSADDFLKEDKLLDSADDEISGAEKDLDTFDKAEEKSEAKDKKDSESKEEDEGEIAKAASVKTAMNVCPNPPKDGGNVNPQLKEADITKKQSEGGEGGDPMKAATGKAASVDEIRQKLADLVAAKAKMKEASMNKTAQTYPFKDQETPVENTNAETASAQASEINKEMSGGFQVPNETLGITGQGGKEAPAMNISEPYNKAAEAANAYVRKATVEAIAKTRVAMEVACMQQLKEVPGMDNPLKQELVDRFAEAGLDKRTAAAIVHNAFLDKYEDMQKVVIAAAFDVLSTQPDEELVKVASYTKDFVNDDKEKEENKDLENKEATLEKGTTVTASLRGSQVSVEKDNSLVYNDFWRRSYAQNHGRKI